MLHLNAIEEICSTTHFEQGPVENPNEIGLSLSSTNISTMPNHTMSVTNDSPYSLSSSSEEEDFEPINLPQILDNIIEEPESYE